MGILFKSPSCLFVTGLRERFTKRIQGYGAVLLLKLQKGKRYSIRETQPIAKYSNKLDKDLGLLTFVFYQ
jgi:hypothetical protein